MGFVAGVKLVNSWWIRVVESSMWLGFVVLFGEKDKYIWNILNGMQTPTNVGVYAL